VARFRNKDQKVQALAKIGIFGGMTKTDLGVMAKYTTEMEIAAGTVIVKEGRVGTQLLYIESGEVEVKRKGRKLATLKRGDVVGELSLIDGQPAIADVTVTKDAVALVMSVQDFQSVISEAPSFTTKLLKAVVARLREADKTIAG
jgi:CRP/FNR family cyclic AMP-dependent transcriptional regulator